MTNKLLSDMDPEPAERIIAGAIAYYRGCSDEVIARQVWIALKSHHRNKHSDSLYDPYCIHGYYTKNDQCPKCLDNLSKTSDNLSE